ALGVVVRGVRQLLHRERRGGHHEQGLDGLGQLVERVARDQAERTVHEASLSTSVREILIGAKGCAWSIETSPVRRSSRSARNATACSTRERPVISCSKSIRERRLSTERNRSRNWPTGGERSAMCARESCAGPVARRRVGRT